MKEFKYKFIILEFSYDDILNFPFGSGIPEHLWKKLEITPKYLVRFIAEIQVIYGVNVMFAGNATAARTAAFSIFKRVTECK